MSDAFSRRGFGALLLSGGAGLLLGAPSVASARHSPPVPFSSRVVCRLGALGLEVELHLHNIQDRPLLLSRGLITMQGGLHVRSRRYPIDSMVDSLVIGSFAQSRVGPRRPPPLSLAPDAEGHYATFHGPVPEGLEGSGVGLVRLEARPAPSGGRTARPVVAGFAALRVEGEVRYSI